MGIREFANERLKVSHRPVPQTHLDLFKRKSENSVFPGSVLRVISYNTADQSTISRFTGILIAVKRTGHTVAFTLRNIIQKTGVEMRFTVASPMIKSIEVVAKATKGRGHRKTQRALPRGR